MNDDFMPNAVIETLRERAKIMSRIRTFFDSRDFFEVQTPALSHDTVVDRFINPLQVPLQIPGSEPDIFYLQTSPEFAMKRLLAAGGEAIYQICPAFRADEIGDLHNIEFTMLEWYRVGDTFQQGMDLLDDLSVEILGCPPAIRLSWQDAAVKFCQGLDPGAGDSHEHLFAEYIEPGLQTYESVILYDWPADQAALANVRVDQQDPNLRYAERFELYVRGVELANGYHELTDAQELESRNLKNNALRTRDDRSSLPVNSRLMDAMRYGLPDCCGVALGVDRLVMLALGKTSIAEVMAFDSRRA